MSAHRASWCVWQRQEAMESGAFACVRRFRCLCGTWGWATPVQHLKKLPVRPYVATRSAELEALFQRSEKPGKPDVTVYPMSAARGQRGGYVPPGVSARERVR